MSLFSGTRRICRLHSSGLEVVYIQTARSNCSGLQVPGGQRLLASGVFGRLDNFCCLFALGGLLLRIPVSPVFRLTVLERWMRKILTRGVGAFDTWETVTTPSYK